MAVLTSILPNVGERCLFVGKTGSGKTVGALSIALMLPFEEYGPLIIYDTKIDETFDRIPRRVVSHPREIAQILALENNDVVNFVVRPPVELLNDRKALDDLLWWHYLNLHNSIILIDELTTFENEGRSIGLNSILARGRSKKITTISATQRPAWVSRSALTENENYYIFRVIDSRDKRTLAEIIPDFDKLPNAERYHFYYYNPDMDAPLYLSPIPIDIINESAYSINDAKSKRTPVIWI